jgi:hypothetical protein
LTRASTALSVNRRGVADALVVALQGGAQGLLQVVSRTSTPWGAASLRAWRKSGEGTFTASPSALTC